MTGTITATQLAMQEKTRSSVSIGINNSQFLQFLQHDGGVKTYPVVPQYGDQPGQRGADLDFWTEWRKRQRCRDDPVRLEAGQASMSVEPDQDKFRAVEREKKRESVDRGKRR